MMMLLALIPALCFGSVSIITTLCGGKPVQGTLGQTLGALILAAGIMFCYVIPKAGWEFAMNPRIWVVGVLSGVFWAVGSAGQFMALKPLGVSVAFPISTASQIVGNALMAAIVLGQWKSVKVWMLGLLAIVLVSVGALFTSVQDKKSANAHHISKADFTKGLIDIAISTAGFMMYFVFPNLLHKYGYISDKTFNAPNGNGLYYMTAVVGPQAIGQVIGAIIILLVVTHQPKLLVEKHTFKNVITGLVWGVGNVFMFICAASPQVGQAIATTFSQLGVLIGTFGGILILHEHKSKRQMVFIVIGSIMIVAGGVVMGLFTSK